MKELSYDDKKMLNTNSTLKYMRKYTQLTEKIDNTSLSKLALEIRKIRPQTLKNLCLLTLLITDSLDNHNQKQSSFSIEFVQYALRCSKATAYDYMRAYAFVVVINDMILESKLKNMRR